MENSPYQISLPPMDTYEIKPDSLGKKVTKKKGRRYIEDAWKIVSERDGAICRRCESIEKLTLDHIVPAFFIGQMFGLVRNETYDDLENLEILCRRCNAFKANRLDFLNPKTKPLLIKYIGMI